MKKNYNFILLVFLFSPLFSALGQESTSNANESLFRNAVPPAPNAASLGKYGEIPVSLASGTPNISIPLGELKQGDLSVPIQLSYHASGIKVEDVASWIGLGWSLDAGGVITRTVRGRPDDDFNNGYFKNPEITDEFLSVLGNLKAIESNDYDSQPDLYFFNIMGYSGELLINKDKAIFTNPHQDIKVNILENQDYKWLVVLPNGVKCYFGKSGILGALDNTQTYSDYQELEQDVVTAWYIGKIEAPNGIDYIHFEYDQETISYTNSPMEVVYQLRPGQVFLMTSGGSYYCKVEIPDFKDNNYITTNQHSIKKLSGTTGSVEYIKSSELRKDLKGSKALSNIIFRDKHQNLIKQYDLVQNYFSTGEIINNSDAYNSHRLRLDEIKVLDNKGVEVKKYVYEYYDLVLPDRLSFAKDHWGYYNNNQVSTGVPKLIKKADGNWVVINSGGIRDTDPSKVNACMLKKITYPTGGSSTFIYEANTYSYVGKDKIKEPIWERTTLSSNTRPIDANGEYIDGYKEFSFEVLEPYITLVRANAASKYMNEPVVAMATLNYEYRSSPDAYVSSDCSKDKTSPDDPSSGCGRSFEGYVALDKGKYTLTVNGEYHNNDYWASANITIDRVIGYKEGLFYAGGVRIKQIINNDGVNSYTKSYFYEGDEDLSSGVLVNEPLYHFDYRAEEEAASAGFQNMYVDCRHDAYAAASKVQLGSDVGSTVTYSKVKVVDSEGYTTTTFTSAKDYLDFTRAAYPFPPSLSRRLYRGKQKEVVVRDENDNVLSRTVNHYNFEQSNSSLGSIISKGVVIGKKIHRFQPLAQDYVYKFYDSRVFNPLPIKTESYTYFRGDSIGTTTLYEYDEQKRHNQVVNQLVQLGNKTTITQYVYPTDKTDAVYQQMVNLNMIASPVEQVVSSRKELSEAFIKKEVHHYAQTSTGEPYLYKIEDQTEIANGTATAGTIVYETKDYRNGRLWQEETLREGSKAYLWSQDHNNLVALAVNATKDQILYYSFEEEGNTTEGAKAGEKSLNAGTAGKVINRPTAAGNYLISYYKKNEAGKWIYHQEHFTTASINLTGIIDEVKVYPEGSLMSTYTYKPGVGVSSVTDPTGQTVYYDYDDFGRLLKLRDDNNNILQQYEYKYASE